MKKIKAESNSFNYDILIGKGIISNLGDEIKKRNLFSNYFVVADSKADKLYGKIIRESLSGGRVKYFKFKADEKNKTVEGVTEILSALLKNKFSRDTLIIAVGGGITGDAAGFAASVYMRGVQYIQVPTTLLAAVDSSVGGKTGVNLNNVKNIVGAFKQPEFVLIDYELLNSLPKEEIICGLGEITKYAYLTDVKFFGYFSKNLHKLLSLEPASISKVISQSVKYKVDVVVKDELESGVRKLLNFGHTFAHALETALEHKIKHGQAVIWGIAAAVFLSREMNFISSEPFSKFIELPAEFKSDIKLPAVSANAIYGNMLSDKKNRSGKIKFVLIKDIGEFFISVEADKKSVLKSIEKALELFRTV